MSEARIVAVCVSVKTGTAKKPVESAVAVENHGIKGDAHAGMEGELSHRQVSLLARESVDVMREKGVEVAPGGFGENLLTEGIDLVTLPVSTALRVGQDVLLRVTQIGKVCHTRCAIYYQAGDCIMPREGIFTEVLSGGEVRPGDCVQVLPAAAVLTVSDRSAAGQRKDGSGPVVAGMLGENGFHVLATEIVPDDQSTIERKLRHYARQAGVIVTTGGTGIGPRDVTPEATKAVIVQELPGFGEVMRNASFQITPNAILSRATAGVCGRCLIVNLPGSPKGAKECLEMVLPSMRHAFDMLRGKGH